MGVCSNLLCRTCVEISLFSGTYSSDLYLRSRSLAQASMKQGLCLVSRGNTDKFSVTRYRNGYFENQVQQHLHLAVEPDVHDQE